MQSVWMEIDNVTVGGAAKAKTTHVHGFEKLALNHVLERQGGDGVSNGAASWANGLYTSGWCGWATAATIGHKIISRQAADANRR